MTLPSLLLSTIPAAVDPSALEKAPWTDKAACPGEGLGHGKTGAGVRAVAQLATKVDILPLIISSVVYLLASCIEDM